MKGYCEKFMEEVDETKCKNCYHYREWSECEHLKDIELSDELFDYLNSDDNE